MSLGLSEMLIRLGIKHTLFFEGLADITYCSCPRVGSFFFYKLKKKILKEARFLKFVFRLRKFSVIVVVSNLPGVFYRDVFRVNLIRKFLKKTKILNYDLHYLGTHPDIQKYLVVHNHYGFRHYDGYLLGSIENYNKNTLQDANYTKIGFSFLKDIYLNTSIPGKGNFVIIDFERKEEHLKNIENTSFIKRVLTAIGINYTQLDGQYDRKELIALFKQSKMFFMTTPESFGLSIVEAQLCGNYILTPSIKWPMAHITKEKVLTENFVIYKSNDDFSLQNIVRKLMAEHDSNKIIARMQSTQPEFYEGNIRNLEEFLIKL